MDFMPEIICNIEKNRLMHRYLSYEDFKRILENKQLYFSKITNWDDPWERSLFQIDYILKNGEIFRPTRKPSDDYYGLCFSKKVESDALWRIYSSDCRGVKLEIKASEVLIY